MIVTLKPGHPLVGDYCNLRIQLWPDCAAECSDEVGEILADPRWAIFCAVAAGGETAGFIEIHLRDYAEAADHSPVPFMEGWFVSPAHRRRGIGRELVKAAEQWAVSHGFEEIGSDSQLENTAAIDAHQKLGFQIVERNVCFLKKLV